MTTDPLRQLLGHIRDHHVLFLLGDQIAKKMTLLSASDVFHLERMTAFQKTLWRDLEIGIDNSTRKSSLMPSLLDKRENVLLWSSPTVCHFLVVGLGQFCLAMHVSTMRVLLAVQLRFH